MKNYSLITRRRREADQRLGKLAEGDVLLTSEEFLETFRPYIDDMARYKVVKGRKYSRSTSYAHTGCMDINDLYQEAYLAFLEAYAIADKDKPGAELWAYLKKSTLLNIERQLRFKKDGVRIPDRQLFISKSVNTNVLTQLFSQIDKVFFNNQEEVALTSYETDLIGAFLDVHFDEYLDLRADGSRNLRGIERIVLKELYGLDTIKYTYSELSDKYRTSQSTLRKVKERAIKKLKSEESLNKIADFLHEYRINTQADTEKYRK